MSALRVVVADDNYLVRAGVCRLLADGDDVDVCADASSGPELLAVAHEHGPDAVLTDIRMPPTHRSEGIDAALRIRRELPDTGVVVLSQHADAAYAHALFCEGTDGLAYLLKERVGERDELVRALRATADGGSVVDPHVVDVLLNGRASRQDSLLRRLTEREHEVLREMAGGRTNTAIAGRLYISESAVSKHVASIFTKLGLVEDPTVDRRVSAVLAFVTEAQST